MRDHSTHREVSREKAVSLLLGAVSLHAQTETVSIAHANGRVLAVDACAQLDMPNCLTCNMDSVAVHWEDFKDGLPDTTGWRRGCEWEFANTGIGMPEGYDTAVVIEHVQLADDYSWITFDSAPSRQYAGTSPAGCRMHKGDVLVPAGTVLTPLLVSHIASGNNAAVEVYKKPRVAFIPTGNELVIVGNEVPRGKNIETNSLLAAGKIDGWGGICKVWDVVPDNPEAIKAAVLAAAAESDIVVLNAGSSKGSDDWNIEMLEEIGQVLYHETNHGPGHHSSGSVVQGVPVVGISGPPGGAAFSLDFYLYPVMRAYFSLPTDLERKRVRLAQDFPGKSVEALRAKRAAESERTCASGHKGEVRPSVVQDGRVFYGVKQLALAQDENSACLVAFPASSTHLAPPEAELMDCYYLLDDNRCPFAGDVIEVEVRPQ